jgi:hypothetical protein
VSIVALFTFVPNSDFERSLRGDPPPAKPRCVLLLLWLIASIHYHVSAAEADEQISPFWIDHPEANMLKFIVLVVEDDPFQRAFVADLLKDEVSK